jgi:catechol 2,3-dioxygenase-like lactoylglutathione lyase family enzyme
MFSHIMIGANNIEESKKFYDAILGELGYKPGMVDPKGRCFYFNGDSILANGGSSCEDAPGIREGGAMGDMYLAYLRDPAGNKICALLRMG